MTALLGLMLLFLVVSFLYSSIGHGGASGYIAMLTLLGVGAAFIRPSALVLNVFVASISFYHYYKSGYFRWKLFYPFGLVSVPMAFLGSYIQLNPTLYKQIIGVCLFFAVLRILGAFTPKEGKSYRELPLLWGLVIGIGLGLLSGMIGIGGGIILSPIILLFRWGNLKEAAAVSALFIVVNSLAGIVGLVNQEVSWHPQLAAWVAIAIIGGYLGAYWGSKRAENRSLKNVLAFVLFLASIKLVFI